MWKSRVLFKIRLTTECHRHERAVLHRLEITHVCRFVWILRPAINLHKELGSPGVDLLAIADDEPFFDKVVVDTCSIPTIEISQPAIFAVIANLEAAWARIGQFDLEPGDGREIPAMGAGHHL